MHIGMFCDEYPPSQHGEIGSFCRDLSEGLTDAGHRVTVFGLYDSTEPQCNHVQDGEVDGVRVLRFVRRPLLPVEAINLVADRWDLYRKVARLITQEGIEVVEAPESAGWFPRGIPEGVPLVTRLHGGMAFFGRELGRRYSRIQSWCEYHQLLRSHAIIAVSNYVGHWTMKQFGFDTRYEVIHNSVRERGLGTGETDGAEILGDNSPYFLFFGPVRPEKGLESLVKAVNRVFSSHRDAVLVIAGDNDYQDGGRPYEKTLRQYVSDENQSRIRFFGGPDREKELLPLISSSLFCVLPFHSEAFSRAPLEAMALGKAVVYSNAHSGPEVIRHNCDGWLVDPVDIDDVAWAIEVLLTNRALRGRLGVEAKKTFERRFHWPEWVDANVEQYHRVVAEYRSG